jgi:putative acetyltransferase
VIVRSFAKGDEAGIRSVLLAAFPTSAEADLVDELRAGHHAEIELLAEESGQIVGHILFSPLRAPFRALALAPVSVAPAFQGLGIGSALIERGHELARDEGWQASFVLGEPDYYDRFGYSPDAARPFDCAYSGPHLMMLVLNGSLPAAQGKLTYPPPFAQLD